jgi:hypothetical protein
MTFSYLLLPSSDRVSRFFVRRPTPLRLPFIPELLALGQRELHFYFAALEVHPHRDQRQSLLLSLADQLADFFFVHEQFAGAEGGVVVHVAVLVGADVGIEQPEFAIFDEAVRIFEVGEAAANGFGLGSGQHHATLKFFQQEVVMRSDPINSGIALAAGGGLAARRFLRSGLRLMCGLARHGAQIQS